ncbi:MAG: DUF4198 domain-containing protein [Fimbriimonadaceae bacterium]|nr:DUF4198 domain-containing protein [Chitinophagales bacterium]
MKKTIKQLSVLSMLFFCAALFCAHEYILISEDYFLTRGDKLYVHLFVSQGFNIELERPLQKSITRNFSLETNTVKTNLLQTTKDDQISVIDTIVNFDGQALISMERDYSRIELDPEKFAAYLKEDHLDNIKFDPANTTTNQREKYSRYLKCLILSGDDVSGNLFKKELNYDLEIILLDNPYLKKTGDELQFQVKFMGKPLSMKTVTARNRTGDENAISSITKTDENGIAKIKLDREGTWILHLTHMIPCADKNDCDWESFWASYSFGVKGE